MDHLTMLDVSPPDLVSAAAEAGFDFVGLRVHPAAPGEEPWPMGAGSPMLEETLRRLEDTDVRVLDVEVFRLLPDTRVSDWEPAFEAGARLGARYATVNCMDPEVERARERFAEMAAAARSYGLQALIEPIGYTEVSSLEAALRLVEGSGGAILVDTLHFHRYGGDLERLRALDPAVLSYVQLCDAPADPPSGLAVPERLPRGQDTGSTDLQLESRALRLMPGEGELPLGEILAALPADLPVAVEAPNLPLAESLTPAALARRARDATRRVTGS